jgi:hypothetical protein
VDTPSPGRSCGDARQPQSPDLFRVSERQHAEQIATSGPFDSRLEADFAAEFKAKHDGTERKWELCATSRRVGASSPSATR